MESSTSELGLEPRSVPAHNDGRWCCFSVNSPNASARPHAIRAMVCECAKGVQGSSSCRSLLPLLFGESPLIHQGLPQRPRHPANLPVQTQQNERLSPNPPDPLVILPLEHFFHSSRANCKHVRKPRFRELTWHLQGNSAHTSENQGQTCLPDLGVYLGLSRGLPGVAIFPSLTSKVRREGAYIRSTWN